MEILHDQKLLSHICQSKLLIGNYSEINEPVNVFRS